MTYLAVASLLPPVTINGMFYVAKTEYLKSIHAFRQIETQLCDDLALATQVKRSGGSIHQGTAPLELRVSVRNAQHYWSIMHRWFVFADILTARQSALGQATLALLLGLPSVLLWFVILTAFSSPTGLVASLFLLSSRYFVIRRMLAATQVPDLPMNFLWSLVSELLQPIHFAHAKLVRIIKWRHRKIRVLRDGSFLELG
jgi:ceramide glucosyltransferase